ncbi:hypothetical protein BAUCODRAFT_411770 [Baudoinia panamericana UAMH 10762]|uniref:Uncharacterized protein n=1 Tax=Baudoinia panamericana (strain UAMH 10762) TaxID=717646 RepID=M2LU50_BAUPA|nr:uncharacterized protein BAUCODRAFT_411770 [Baudoinia panamericana UAMH 10762]EMC98062.1 hypothetical protein BAUCODRAFT_411770 [Baudoinia panamericana UAMH 10762]
MRVPRVTGLSMVSSTLSYPHVSAVWRPSVISNQLSLSSYFTTWMGSMIPVEVLLRFETFIITDIRVLQLSFAYTHSTIPFSLYAQRLLL